MLTPAFANTVSYFYPIGNTPAVSLTQTIPPGEPVDIPLLECGDVRNILFTGYVDARVMDITCCDNQKAVIARNILLLTLLIDGNDSSDDLIWNLYYHLNIDNKSLELLRSQAQKLHDLSTSRDVWQHGKYGSRLRFCDTATLEDVRAMWALYAIERKGVKAKKFKLRFDSILREVNKKEEEDAIITSYRAMIPALQGSMFDVSDLHFHYYWKHGSLELDANTRASAKFPNPMFMTLEDEAIVHYGIDPLMGFHLTLACSSLEAQNPLSQTLYRLSGPKRIINPAKAEFNDWAASYRKQNNSITLRFSTADASTLAHTMQQRSSGGARTSGMYRQQYDTRPLLLDSPDYVYDKVPLTFDVIDTSNLCDHFGSLVLFEATAPLLRNSLAAVLYVEVLNRDPKNMLNDLLCGHVPTISSILGLSPTDYWTNTSHVSAFDEEVVNPVPAGSAKNPHIYLRTRWIRPAWLVLDSRKSESFL
ncbi:hypothetical protein F5Y09DRAFT_353008 [Xylaria sp. FL1042]|nr:hypothetical protein F5Y09DRAFT_353008 [Xylaria sp. FL1042]